MGSRSLRTKERSKSMNTQIVVFDFDGVFVRDSDAVFKKEAWGIALQGWTGQYEKFLEEGDQLYGGGKPGGRMAIFRHIFECLGEPADAIPALVTEVAQVFDKHVQTRILDAGLVTGALGMLETLSKRDIGLYLNSGTATSALQRTARNLKIEGFFSEILGSTKEPSGGSKVDNLQYITKREQVEISAMLFVGDGESDHKAALEFGCSFVGIANKWNQWGKEEKLFPVVTELQDVLRFVN